MTERRIKGWHVLVVVLGFFAVTIGVNATFVTFALSTFSGEVSEQPYVQGLDFNDTLAARAEQTERGWSATLAQVREPDGALRLTLEVRDAAGRLVPGRRISGVIGRPATAAHDRALEFEETGAGYVARLEGLDDGEWELSARTTFYDGAPFEAHKRLWLR